MAPDQPLEGAPREPPRAALEDGLVLFERVRAEAGHIPSVRALLAGCDRWLMDCVQDGRNRRLESYLRIPTTSKRRRLALRNTWLAKAAAALDVTSEWAGCVRLADEWDTFLTRGGWSSWRGLSAPPDEIASELRRALFYASRFNADQAALGATGLFQIDVVRSAFRSSN